MVIIRSDIVVYGVFSKSVERNRLQTPSTILPVKHLPFKSSVKISLLELSVTLKLSLSEFNPPKVSIFPMGYA